MAVLTTRNVERDTLTAHTRGAVITDSQMRIGSDHVAILASFDRQGVMRRVTLFDASCLGEEALTSMALWCEIPGELQEALLDDVRMHQRLFWYASMASCEVEA